MEFFETVAKRRSERQFTPTAVPEAVIEKAVRAALLAANSSNLQPWEFYWVKTPGAKAKLVEYCFNQSAARTANQLVVAVARVDTWGRNRDILLGQLSSTGTPPKYILDYYNKVVPFFYWQDPFGILGVVKKVAVTAAGFFRPVPRSPLFRSQLFSVVTKTTALACENLMLAITAQGYGSCPMEGFDERRVKKLLGLGCKARVTMVIGIGEIDPNGRVIPQYRVDEALVFKKI